MIGKILKYMRNDKGLSQYQLAQILNSSQQNLSRYEKNQRIISFDLIEQIANNCDYEIQFVNKKTKNILNTKNDYKTIPRNETT